MEKIDFRFFANQQMFDLSDDEINQLSAEFIILQKQFALLAALDTNGVEPMVYPFEDETTYLRDDEVSDCLPVVDVLLNAKRQEDQLVVIPKVVG